MRLMVSCMQCLQEFGKPSNEFARVEFRDDGRYELTCSVGHTTTTILQQQKFEVLFEIGAYAILDGYYREAVSSFSTTGQRADCGASGCEKRQPRHAHRARVTA